MRLGEAKRGEVRRGEEARGVRWVEKGTAQIGMLSKYDRRTRKTVAPAAPVDRN